MQHNGPVRRLIPVVLLGLLVLVGLGWVSVASVHDVRTVALAPEQSTAPSAAPIRVAVVGDSLSAGRSRFLGNGLDDESWMTYANGDGIEFVGGWARAGARPDQMADAVRPIAHVDVLVVLAGTNAVLHGERVSDVAHSYERIADTVGADRVLVSAIPPYTAHAEAALTYNRDLRSLTQREGWTWVDPWTDARHGDAWAAGFSVDGVHPAGPEQYAVLGRAFRALILADVPARSSARS
jgi:hypothetical protein